LPDYDWMTPSGQPRRRRIWPIAVPLIVLAVAAAGWCAFWYSAAAQADRLVAEWLDREAKLGRVYACGTRSIEGFPFHIVLHCDEARAQLDNLAPPLGLNLSDVEVTAYLYQPTVLTAEFSGPLAIGEPNQAPRMIADWETARTSVRGTPRAPERISIVLEKPIFERVVGDGRQKLVTGEHVEFSARIAAGTPSHNPLLDVSAKAVATSAPGVHPLATEPIDADIDTRLHGLKDFAPKSWPDRFREIQAANGRIEVRSLRVKQGEWLATGSGSVGLTAAGRLNGEVIVTVAGLDKLMKQLGVEYTARSERANSAISMLNQLLPGLGDAAREHAGAGAAAGLALLGEQTELEGRKATRLPLRFDDGAIFLGPIPVGQAEALF
jgi:hypothetical protein